jgi:hypothetical protein
MSDRGAGYWPQFLINNIGEFHISSCHSTTERDACCSQLTREFFTKVNSKEFVPPIVLSAVNFVSFRDLFNCAVCNENASNATTINELVASRVLAFA